MTLIPGYRPLMAKAKPDEPGGVDHGRTYIVFDLETGLIMPGRIVPRIACCAVLTTARRGVRIPKSGTTLKGPVNLGIRTYLMDATATLDYLVTLIHAVHALPPEDRPVIIAHNLAFDLLTAISNAQHVGLGDGLLNKALDLVECGVFKDTVHRGQLRDLGIDGIGIRNYKLVTEVKRHFGKDISHLKSGPDAYRLRYNELLYTPIQDWPRAAITYPIGDVVEEFELFRIQCEETFDGVTQLGPYGDGVQDELHQVKAGISLSMGSVWGFRTNLVALTALNTAISTEVAALDGPLQAGDILEPKSRRDPTLKRNMGNIEARIEVAYNYNPPRTDTKKYKPATLEKFPFGKIRTDKETLEGATSDPLLQLLAKRATLTKAKEFVISMRRGGRYPVCPRYSPVKETGRASSSKPNVQNIPRKGGVRESFTPRPGYLYINVDYDSLELRAWAEVCEAILGYSTLAEWYRRDPDFDPHTYMAGKMYDPPLEYAEAMALKLAKDPGMKEMRSLAKVPNFGYPGGMGAETLMESARKSYGITITLAKAKWLKEVWLDTWQEAGPYLAHVNKVLGMHDTTVVKQYVSGRIRAGVRYCQIANTWFQGLAGDGAKEAVWLVTRAMYSEGSPLSGCRMAAFVHDELLLEVPIAQANAAADELVRLMVLGMQRYIRNVPVRCEASVATCWSKEAWSTRNEQGEYTVWSPS